MTLRTGLPFLRGSAMAAALAAVSRLLAGSLSGEAWRFSILLGVSACCCALLAWFLHLAEEGFLRRPRDGSGGSAAARPTAGATAGATENKAVAPGGHPELAIFAPRDGDLVPRSAEGAASADRSPGKPRPHGDSMKAARAAFVWAAAELTLLSAALYGLAGTGSRYFL